MPGRQRQARAPARSGPNARVRVGARAAPSGARRGAPAGAGAAAAPAAMPASASRRALSSISGTAASSQAAQPCATSRCRRKPSQAQKADQASRPGTGAQRVPARARCRPATGRRGAAGAATPQARARCQRRRTWVSILSRANSTTSASARQSRRAPLPVTGARRRRHLGRRVYGRRTGMQALPGSSRARAAGSRGGQAANATGGRADCRRSARRRPAAPFAAWESAASATHHSGARSRPAVRPRNPRRPAPSAHPACASSTTRSGRRARRTAAPFVSRGVLTAPRAYSTARRAGLRAHGHRHGATAAAAPASARRRHQQDARCGGIRVRARAARPARRRPAAGAAQASRRPPGLASTGAVGARRHQHGVAAPGQHRIGQPGDQGRQQQAAQDQQEHIGPAPHAQLQRFGSARQEARGRQRLGLALRSRFCGATRSAAAAPAAPSHHRLQFIAASWRSQRAQHFARRLLDARRDQRHVAARGRPRHAGEMRFAVAQVAGAQPRGRSGTTLPSCFRVAVGRASKRPSISASVCRHSARTSWRMPAQAQQGFRQRRRPVEEVAGHANHGARANCRPARRVGCPGSAPRPPRGRAAPARAAAGAARARPGENCGARRPGRLPGRRRRPGAARSRPRRPAAVRAYPSLSRPSMLRLGSASRRWRRAPARPATWLSRSASRT
jgi:hypothetical protein